MKLMRVGAPGQEKPAVRMADGSVIDVSSVVGDYDGAWLAAGGIAGLEARLADAGKGDDSLNDHVRGRGFHNLGCP